MGGRLSLCRDAVGVFYSPSRVGKVGFYGISTIVGYLMILFYIYIYIKYIYDLYTHFVYSILKQAWVCLFLRIVKWFQVFLYNRHNLTLVIYLPTVCSIWPNRTLSGAATPVREDLGAIARKRYQYSPNLQGWSLAIRLFNVISRTRVGGEDLTPQQRCSRCIQRRPLCCSRRWMTISTAEE